MLDEALFLLSIWAVSLSKIQQFYNGSFKKNQVLLTQVFDALSCPDSYAY